MDFVPFESKIQVFPEDPLQTYGLRRSILDEVSKGKLTTISLELFVNDDKLIRSLADVVRSDQNKILNFRQMVHNSKYHNSTGFQIAAANAITVLVAANISFIEEDFKSLKIPNANIRDGIFTNCDFTEADLTNVNMKNCKLQGCNFTNTILKGVDLGIYPSIEVNYPINNLRLSSQRPDGFLLFSVHQYNQKVILWDHSNYKKIDEFNGQACAFSPIESAFAIGNNAKIQTFKEFDKKNFKLIRSLEGHQELVTTLEYTPDGLELISGSLDTSVNLWNVKSGDLVRSFQGHTNQVNSVAYCPELSIIISAGADKTIILWDKETGKLQKKLNEHGQSVNYVGFFRNGESFISASDDNMSTIKAWNSRNGYSAGSYEGIHFNGVKSISFSPDKELFVSASKEKICVVNQKNKNIQFILPIQGDTQIYSAIFGPDQKKIISGGDDRRISFIDCTSAKSKKIYEVPLHLITCLAISQDGTCLASGGNDNVVRLWATSNGRLLKVLQGHTDEVTSVEFSPNDSNILSGSRDKTCILWNKNSGNPVDVFKEENHVNSVAFNPSSADEFICAVGNELKMYNISQKKLRQTFEEHSDTVTVVAISSDGAKIASGSLDQTIIIWEHNGNMLRKIHAHKTPVLSIKFSPDNHLLISSSQDKEIKTWNMSNYTNEMEIEAHYLNINSIAYSPDGSQILSGSNDCKVKIFKAKSGAEIKSFDSHTGNVISVGFSRCGTIMYSAGWDNAIRVYQKSSKLGSESRFVLVLEITPDETPMKCTDLILSGVKELSDFNKSIFVNNGAKTYMF